jgi:hypothetical protein
MNAVVKMNYVAARTWIVVLGMSTASGRGETTRAKMALQLPTHVSALDAKVVAPKDKAYSSFESFWWFVQALGG